MAVKVRDIVEAVDGDQHQDANSQEGMKTNTRTHDLNHAVAVIVDWFYHIKKTADEVQLSGLKTNERIRCQCEEVDRLSAELRLIGQLVKDYGQDRAQQNMSLEGIHELLADLSVRLNKHLPVKLSLDLDVDPVMVVKDARLQDLVFEAVESIIMLLQELLCKPVCKFGRCEVKAEKFFLTRKRGSSGEDDNQAKHARSHSQGKVCSKAGDVNHAETRERSRSGGKSHSPGCSKLRNWKSDDSGNLSENKSKHGFLTRTSSLPNLSKIKISVDSLNWIKSTFLAAKRSKEGKSVEKATRKPRARTTSLQPKERVKATALKPAESPAANENKLKSPISSIVRRPFQRSPHSKKTMLHLLERNRKSVKPDGLHQFVLWRETYRSAEDERKRETQKRARLSLGSKIGQMSQAGLENKLGPFAAGRSGTGYFITLKMSFLLVNFVIFVYHVTTFC